jgi:hypothetical protein
MTDQELEVYFRQMNELFRQEGWLNLLTELRLNSENINSIEHTKDEKELYFRKGQLNIIGFLLNLESTTRVGQEDFLRTEDPIESQYSDV